MMAGYGLTIGRGSCCLEKSIYSRWLNGTTSCGKPLGNKLLKNEFANNSCYLKINAVDFLISFLGRVFKDCQVEPQSTVSHHLFV